MKKRLNDLGFGISVECRTKLMSGGYRWVPIRDDDGDLALWTSEAEAIIDHPTAKYRGNKSTK